MCVCGGELNFVPTEQPQQLPAARPKCTTTIPATPTPTPLCKDGPSSSAGLKVPILSFIFSSVQSANGLELFSTGNFWALGFEPRKEEIKKMLNKIDRDGRRIIGYPAFFEMMKEKFGERGTMEEIMKAFQLFDHDGTGKISFSNLKQVANELGENLSDEELHAMINEADFDGDGAINEEEFYRIMTGTNSF
ncbi:unnamed protein product [Sphagnum troendelagicum]|uniref:EF-hand domain-containing protein n=1 Tax=Sphagnum jensenii TaxID=128206 RepID=A0ABP0WFX2_9BRYO